MVKVRALGATEQGFAGPFLTSLSIPMLGESSLCYLVHRLWVDQVTLASTLGGTLTSGPYGLCPSPAPTAVVGYTLVQWL